MKRLDIDAGRGARPQFAARDDAGDSDAGPVLRKIRRAPSGAGRYGRAHAGSFGDLRHSAGRHQKGVRQVMSFLLPCPNCGKRSVYEFRFGGEVKQTPAPDAPASRMDRLPL